MLPHEYVPPRSRDFSHIWNFLTLWYFVVLTYPIAELATSCNFVLPGFYAEVRCSQRTAHPAVYNMLLQCYSHSRSLTIITNSDKHGGGGRERGKMLGFGEPNWLVILVWVSPQTE